MTRETVPVQETGSISDTLRKKNDAITRRAYEIFEHTGGVSGYDLDHWLAAERELLWQPPLELREKDNEFVLEMVAPGVNSKDIHIEVSPEDLLLEAQTHHEHHEDDGTVHSCEFDSGAMFRSVHFPKKIDPKRVKAELRNGMLHLKAPVDLAESA